ncbi:endoplasmic reticulum-based factor for assembly of V-ATPase-domain-containing protein [Fimicolochytrium jonesii]|uniref:endoplasmic reticulum-based factor for assembly of V-ATPase-domain-containing protein n=1 Tax=Fimicolochytrium jonesii TaxID=1396493 RepID=UPI0022FEA21A|nr:endoplasmic reticulum-based factor for assembly of V-ATPase-domain-containing protein [Fimicolochytrium jonesii]KAI8815708.1 endoplasmic reticulum-based factor for assembly of V-ATPase-domain-containing protein [Fimicolochytrium jonesii]
MLLTSRIIAAVDHLLQHDDGISKGVADKLRTYSSSQDQENRPTTIPHGLLQQISQDLLKTEKDGKYQLHRLMEGSKIALQGPPERVKSPQLLATLDRIRIQLENAEYAEMTKNVRLDFREEQNGPLRIGAELRGAFSQMSAVFNVLFSIAAVFLATFWISGTVTREIGYKTLVSLAAAMIVAIAEGWFFTRDLIQEDKNAEAGKEKAP